MMKIENRNDNIPSTMPSCQTDWQTRTDWQAGMNWSTTHRAGKQHKFTG
ncbi:hypothetical protein BMS3Abin15_00134 [bacterium BMS3Abin15]|nr:hypothetical protein BMS3Abin15_00134 [bacterium BMS3Abin15]